jgi:ribosomal protein S18 acetylase RimI-like enzyme
MHIRQFQMEDFEDVTVLWKSAGLHLNRSDTRRGLQRKLERDADLFLVAIHEDEIIGVVMGAYDGRRGWINHLAVAEAYRKQGIGGRLLQELEQRLMTKGCDKVNLLIEPANAQVQYFYQQLGYQPRELLYMQKWLIVDDPS